MTEERFWTLPNVVSLSRLGLAGVFVMVDDAAWRLALVGVATTTDYLDGWLARRRGGFSRWGALIDAGTDRAFSVIAVATLAWEGVLSSLAVFVFLSRDLSTAGALLAARRIQSLKGVTFVARFPGKVVTVLQLLALAVAIAEPRRVSALVAVLAVASAVAIIDYSRALWRARMH